MPDPKPISIAPVPDADSTNDYMFRWWGADAQAVADLCPVPVVRERDDGPFVAWFPSTVERQRFLDLIDRERFSGHPFNPEPYSGACVMRDVRDGADTRCMTVAKVVMEYRGETYAYDNPFGYGYPASGVRHMYTEGNYDCDCNRSRQLIGLAGADIEELDCGNQIKLVSLRVFKGRRDATEDDDAE